MNFNPLMYCNKYLFITTGKPFVHTFFFLAGWSLEVHILFSEAAAQFKDVLTIAVSM